MGQEVADLAALQLADEIPGEPAGQRRRLGDQVLRAVLADQRDAALGERPQLGHRQVLDRGQDLDLRGIATGGGDLLADARQVGGDPLGGQAVDQVNHATPAWRPVTPRSRRWEKNSVGSAQIVHIPMSATAPTPACASCRRAIALRSACAFRMAPGMPANAARTSSPTS